MITILIAFRSEAVSQNESEKLMHFGIKTMPAEESLIVFAEQANLDSIYRFEDVKGHITNSINGEYTIVHALKKLTENTELKR